MKSRQSRIIGVYKPAYAATALAAAISACYVPTVVAADSGLMLEEIVVTVRRRVEMEQDVPISMKAMTEDFLRTQNITQVEDLGTKVPSMRISSAGGSLNEPLISLRGQRPSESIFNQDQAVPMYFNEVVISPTQGSNLGFYDLQSVQVLKGPQGTLFGRNSTGGAVLITPKRPGQERGGYAEIKVGDYDLLGFEGAVDLPVTESLTTRIAAHKLDRDGYQENIADNAFKGNDYRDEHSQGIRLSVNFSQDQISNLFVFSHDENDIAAAVPISTVTNPAAGLGWAFANGFLVDSDDYLSQIQDNKDRDDPWKVRTDVDSEEYVKNVFASNTTEFEITDELTVKNIFGYRKVDFRTATDIDGTSYPGFGTRTFGEPGVTRDPRPTDLHSEFFSDELQLLGSAFDDDLEWIVGAYWSKLDVTQDYLVQQNPYPSDTGFRSGIDTGISTALNTSYGIFAEGTYAFTDEWSLTVGLRQSWDDRELTVSKWRNIDRTECNMYDGQAASVENPTPPNSSEAENCERNEDETYSSPTWRMSANYTPDFGGLFYGSISTGYRGGGFNTRGNDDGTLQPFDEELVTTYELGHKEDWDVDWGSIRTSAALYWQDYKDIHQTVSFDNGGVVATRTENASKAEIKGFEFDVTLVPAESLSLNLSYSYIDAEFKERIDVINDIEYDTSSNDFAYIPEQSLTASATYTLPFDPALGEMSLTASVYWQDEMNTHPLVDNFGDFPVTRDPNGATWSDYVFPGEPDRDLVAELTDYSTQDSYEVWSARFDWRNVMESNFDVAAYVNNLTDEEYVLGGLNVVDSGGYGAAAYGAPRTIGASLRYTF